MKFPNHSNRQGFYFGCQRKATQENIMSQTISKRPLTTLQKNTKKSVTVRLKNDVEYRGKIDNVDSYMNLIMTDAEELKDGKTVEKFGRVILRGKIGRAHV